MNRTRKSNKNRHIAAWALAVFGAGLACAGSSGPAYGRRSPGYGYAEPQSSLPGEAQRAVDALQAARSQRGQGAVMADGRLRRAAQALSLIRLKSVSRDACDVSPSLVDAALDWSGVYERPVCQRCFWTRQADADVPAEVIAGMADCMASLAQPWSVGVSRDEADGRTMVSLLAAPKGWVLEPTPRDVPLHQPVTVRGVASEVPSAVLVAGPGLPVEKVPLEVGEGGAFHTVIPGAQRAGVTSISWLGAQGEERARLSMESRTQARTDAFAQVPPPDGSSLPEQLPAFWRALQSIRVSRDLKALERSAALDAAAQEEVNGAVAAAAWLRAPLKRAPPPTWIVLKRVGHSAEDVVHQLRTSAAELWWLTRPVTLRAGAGLLSLGSDAAHPVILGILILEAPDPSAWGRDP